MLSIIVAKAKNNTIGKNNKLLWNLHDDLKRFQDITTGHTIIMGRKTFDSMGKPLENRNNVILTHNKDFKIEGKNIEIVHSVMDLQKYIAEEQENFVIGGAMIYNLLMPYVTKLYVTEIHKDFEGDSFFPKINLDIWKEVSRKKGPKEENNLDYDYVIYEKK